jgi:hypothetical protein
MTSGNLDEFIRSLSKAASTLPIVAPNDHGEFPGRIGMRLGDQNVVRVVVVDTNMLKKDIGYAARKGIRTALMTLANAGAIRILCPHHVIVELFEHREKFAKQSKCSTANWLSEFETTYAPVIQVVRPFDLPLWVGDEVVRLGSL